MKDNNISKVILTCSSILFIGVVSFVYAVITWGFCLSTAWNWYMVPIFHYPPLTLLEAWVLIMVLSLARPNIDYSKHEIDVGKTVGSLLSPWFTLFILSIIKNYVLIDQLQATIIEMMK